MCYYALGSKYTGKFSDKQSLGRHHQQVYHSNAEMCRFNAHEDLMNLIVMIEPQSLAGNYYWNFIRGKAETLEEAFCMLFRWAKSTTNLSAFVDEWRSLRVANFKHSSNSWANVMEN